MMFFLIIRRQYFSLPVPIDFISHSYASYRVHCPISYCISLSIFLQIFGFYEHAEAMYASLLIVDSQSSNFLLFCCLYLHDYAVLNCVRFKANIKFFKFSILFVFKSCKTKAKKNYLSSYKTKHKLIISLLTKKIIFYDLSISFFTLQTSNSSILILNRKSVDIFVVIQENNVKFFIKLSSKHAENYVLF